MTMPCEYFIVFLPFLNVYDGILVIMVLFLQPNGKHVNNPSSCILFFWMKFPEVVPYDL